MVIFDVETVAIADAGQYLEPASAPANYKDEAKIAAYIAEANKAALGKAALDPDLCRVVCIGMARGGSVDISTAPNEAHEREILKWFWQDIGNAHLCGFNVLDFDLPVLMRRSLYLGVDYPRIDISRYRHDRVTDLMQMLSFDGKLKFHGLSFYCKRFGIPDTDQSTGADIAGMVERGEWEAVAAHCRSDVEKTRALAERLGVIKPLAEAVGF